MQLILLSAEEKQAYKGEIVSILRTGDRDFVPPLSARFAQDWEEGYFGGMASGEILAALDGGHLLGFVAFKKNYLYEDIITSVTFPNIYVATLLVHPDARGRHLTREMYTHIFDTLFPTASLFTRTWSTNAAHIGILSRFGFSEIARIKDDRAPGIDTVYFKKSRAECLLS
jgi:ribosomal protein S18 acetylase RimI-like enzyme